MSVAFRFLHSVSQLFLIKRLVYSPFKATRESVWHKKNSMCGLYTIRDNDYILNIFIIPLFMQMFLLSRLTPRKPSIDDSTTPVNSKPTPLLHEEVKTFYWTSTCQQHSMLHFTPFH